MLDIAGVVNRLNTLFYKTYKKLIHRAGCFRHSGGEWVPGSAPDGALSDRTAPIRVVDIEAIGSFLGTPGTGT